MNNVEKYLGTRLTFAEAIELFPDRFLAFENYLDDGNTAIGTLRCVAKTRSEMIPLLKKYADAGNKLAVMYTTEMKGLGGLWQL